jgi:hypothetical protein
MKPRGESVSLLLHPEKVGPILPLSLVKCQIALPDATKFNAEIDLEIVTTDIEQVFAQAQRLGGIEFAAEIG